MGRLLEAAKGWERAFEKIDEEKVAKQSGLDRNFHADSFPQEPFHAKCLVMMRLAADQMPKN